MKSLSIIIITYLIGAIPFAYLFTKFIAGKDVRKFGSGNVGATNASRILGFKFGLVVALLDIAKGFLAVSIAALLINFQADYILLAASLMAVIGHNWSIFLKFSGGKGVAITIGVILRLLFIPGLLFIIIWMILVFLTRYVSLASVAAAVSIPVFTYFFGFNEKYIIFSIIIALLIILRHHANIKRLIKGDERKLSIFSKKKE